MVPTFEHYIFYLAREGKTKGRNEALRWLRDQMVAGLAPKITMQTSMHTWHQFILVMPKDVRPWAGRLWKEYVRYRANHKLKKARLRGKQQTIAARRWAVNP